MNKLKKLYTYALRYPFLIALALFLNSASLIAADLVLDSQTAVDAFDSVNGIHEGELRISGSDISDLSNLSSLVQITGDFFITDNPVLSSLNGLENLQTIGEDLVIANNASLSSLNGLAALTTLGNSLFIIENNGLTDLSGLEGIQSDLIELYVMQNDLLENIDALQGISRVGTLIQILFNPELKTIDGLSNIDQFCSEVLLESNPKLEQINGLSSIRVGTRLTLVNLNISNVDPLSHFNNSILNLVIASNPVLVNVDGISNLGVNNSFVLADNPQLATCCGAFPLFTNFSSLPSSLTIQDNLPGCNSVEEILDDCGVEGCNGPFSITTQAELDAFPDCTTIFGSILIDGSDITDLSPLSNIVEIRGSLDIVNAQITSLTGLESLTTVGKSLSIVGCDLITDFTGLENLTTINNAFNIVQNDALIDFTGLTTLTGSIVTYVVFDNSNLSDFSGPTFSEISNNIYIARNPMLTNLDPLLTVTDTIATEITLEFNEGMTSITGLQNIPYTQQIRVIGMNSLENLNGLEGINGHIQQLVLPINDVLTDISALSNLTSVANLTIASNPLLNDCCGIAQVLDDPNSQVLITENLADCASENAVLLACGFPACNGDVTFSSQAQLNAWITCDTLFGNLKLEGDDITDLSSLSGLVAITGNLSFDGNTNLASLQGLNQLQSVGGSLLLLRANSLTDLSGFDQLNAIGQNLEIVDNNNLVSLQGLEGLTGSVEDLVFFRNASLTDLSALAISTVEMDLIINENNALEHLDGLSSLSGPVERVVIDFNALLADLSGLSNIENILDLLSIIGNDALSNLNGLEGIAGPLGTLTIAVNNQLTDIAALDNLVGINNLSVGDNILLDECCVFAQLLLDDEIPNVFIEGNQNNCSSEIAIINDCTNINGPADLELSLSTSSTSVLSIYEFYDFELTLTNNGEGSVTDPVVDFPVPSGFAFTSSTPGFNGVYGYDIWLGEWRIEGTLLAGESATLEVRFFSLTESAPINVYAQVSESNKPDPDSSPGNGTCCTPIEDDETALTLLPEGMLLTEADLELTGTIDQTEVGEGDIITINLTITNHGPDPASAVRIEYPGTTPNQLSNVFGATSASGGNTFLFPFWFLGDMLPGISETLTLQYEVGALDDPFNLLFEVVESIPNDPDSTPGNAVGGVASEDDEVSFILIPAGFADTDPPIPTLTTPINLVNGAFDVNINFNEEITGLELSDFAISNGTLSNLFGSGNAYSLTVDPDQEGLVTLSLPAGTVVDAAGNENVLSNELQITYEEPGLSLGPDLALSLTSNLNTAPIYSNVIYTLTLSNEGIATADNIVIDIPFPSDLPYVEHETLAGSFDVFLRNWFIPSLDAGEVVTLELTLFTLMEETVPTTLYAQVSQANPVDDDSTPGNWTCVPQGILGCIPNEDDEAAITINVDQAQNNPTVTLSTSSATVMGDFEVAINFSTAVSGLDLSDFSVSNGSVSDLSGAGSEYTLNISPNLPGNLTVALPANRVVDANNNGNLASNQLVIEYIAQSGNETDLELNFSTTETGFVIYDFVTITLTINNTSAVDATNVVVSYPKPENTAFSEQIISAGTYSDFSGEWIIGNVPAGTSEVLEVTWFSLDDVDPIVAYAQVSSTLPDDVDSEPNNGTCCTPVEDDEAVISIDPGTQLRTSSVIEGSASSKEERLKMLAPYPNPVINRLMLSFYVPQARDLQIRLTNAFGEEVYRMTLQLEEGLVKRSIDMSQLPGGMYYLSTDLEGKHRPMPVVKINP